MRVPYNPLRSARQAWGDLVAKDPSWGKLLASAGLTIDNKDEDSFRNSLGRYIVVNRRVPGFEDFAEDGNRGIQPGSPARSLLYHAFASCSVTHYGKHDLRAFPTLEQIDAIENYVYGAKPPSLEELERKADGAELAVAVFAYEYRLVGHTVHRRHADLCFSRTGIARVGTADSYYLERERGYVSAVGKGEPVKRTDIARTKLVRVVPCRYGAFIAARKRGDRNGFGPMRFRTDPGKSDGELDFWVPLHKLFNGDQCISGLQIEVDFHAEHLNEKLHRFHKDLHDLGYDSGQPRSVIERVPFRIEHGIADLEHVGDACGSVLVMPRMQKRLVEPAARNGTPLTYKVPLVPWVFDTSFWVEPLDDTNRRCPEFTNAGTEVLKKRPFALSRNTKFVSTIRTGGYNALHYIDFTGDGYVRATCRQLRLMQNLSAYSILGAPDFFPFVGQRELADWYDSLPGNWKRLIWSDKATLAPLSDSRLPANIQITKGEFSGNDRTVTAVVSGLGGGPMQPPVASPEEMMRASGLPDNASGLFAPGWDISQDKINGVQHLAAYGLGSPFPEDVKICAAMSAYWPAATPDTTRSYPQQVFRVTTPLPDEYAGWDEVDLPRRFGKPILRRYLYASRAHADYVGTALRQGFKFGQLSGVTFQQYTEWTLIMVCAHTALGAQTPEDAAKWHVPSFRKLADKDAAEFERAMRATRARLDPGNTYRLEMFTGDKLNVKPRKQGTIFVEVKERYVLYADTKRVLMRREGGRWSVA
jgi:hypothetical protein